MSCNSNPASKTKTRIQFAIFFFLKWNWLIFPQNWRFTNKGLRGELLRKFTVYKLLSYGRLFFPFFFNRKTLIFSRCVVSEALYHTSSSQSHTHARAHAHEHSSCQSRVQPHGLLLSTQSGYLPLCTVSYSNKHQQHSDPDTFLSHTQANTHPLTNTHLGTMHVSGVSNGQRLQSTYSLSLKKKKRE